MIAFLTDLLNPASPIEDVIFLDKEMEADGEDMRSVIYDLRCKTQDGGEFIVEMQNTRDRRISATASSTTCHTLSLSRARKERAGTSIFILSMACSS